MYAHQFSISTLKEAPADAEIPSQVYSTRAGLVKKLAAGIYTLMPMGLRVTNKIERIIREEYLNKEYPKGEKNLPFADTTLKYTTRK